jgi:gamma-glutamyltranspeptidase/glutathione hydrolase
MIKRITLLSLVIISVSCTSKKEEVRYSGLQADSAMVVCAHPIAAQVGVDIMRKGGNAIDAAIATQFALTIVFPEAGNIGGGGFMVYREAQGQSYALDYRERAPAQAHPDMYLDESGNVISGLSTEGHLASGIPGSVDGMIEAHKKFGKLPWATLVQPAIDLALNGHPLTKRAAEHLNGVQDHLKKYNSVLPEFLIRDWMEGDTIRWIELGHTLERIRDSGRAGFYEGKTAEDLVAEMKRGNGIITHDDLKNYKSRWLDPLQGSYKDYNIISMPPPSSGGIVLLQMLKLIESFPLRTWDHNSAKAVHLLTEVERRAFADRSFYLGDPSFVKVPVDKLLDSQYINERMSSFHDSHATPSSDVNPGTIPGYESTETTHISIVDKDGNAVAVTTTLNDWFGSKVVVSGSGFFLNDEMDDFSAKPGVPNMYGVTGGEANKIEPGKTMLSSMTPTIVEKNGKLFMIAGSPGGSRIITSVFQVILNVVEYDMGMQQAVDAKRFHSQWLPDAIFPEHGLLQPKDSLTLTQFGHVIRPLSDLEKSLTKVGRTDCILVLPNGKLEGGADRFRGDNAAKGF